MAEIVRLRGLREFQRAISKASKESRKYVRDGLKEAARPVVESVKAKEGHWPGASIGTIGPKVTTRGVFVTQRARKVTGLRSDFGALQMTQAFIPALDENEDETVRQVERALDRMLDAARL